MQIFRKFKIILPIFLIITFVAPKAKAANECFEGISRSIFKFNMAFDDVVLEPIAKGYNKLPSQIKTGTSNFTSNLGTLLSIPNNILQGEIKSASESSLKFLVNSTLGFVGIYDASSQLGIKSEKTDFGETMAKWGIGEGPYLDILVLGPSNQRDGIGRMVDIVFDPVGLIGAGPKGAATVTSLAFGLSARSQFRESIDSILYQSADSYAQSRLFFLQNRRYELGTNQTVPYIDPYN